MVRLLASIADASVLGVLERLLAGEPSLARVWAAQGVLELVYRAELDTTVAVAWTDRLLADVDPRVMELGATIAGRLFGEPGVTRERVSGWLKRIETLPHREELRAEIETSLMARGQDHGAE